MSKRRNSDSSDSGPSTSSKKHRRAPEPEEMDVDESSNDADELSSIASTEIQRIRCNDTRSGKILGVHLRNFMCHGNLAVEFNTQSNIVAGKNGSGKSAILTALIIGLGCRANTTDRSNSIKQLIKRGEQSATIEVIVSNNGSEAFEHDKYGDRITIVRTIVASGGSQYKLKGDRNTIISTSRNDLMKMLMYLNIQVDNPVCVLTQDASRSFLRDSNPNKRYKLFRKATQLDIILEKLNACKEQWGHAKGQLSYQEKLSEKLQKTRDEARDKYREVQSVQEFKAELQKLQCQQHWITVCEQEKFIANIQGTVDKSEEERNIFIAQIQESETKEQELKDLYKERQTEIQGHGQTTKDFEARLTEKREVFKEKCTAYMQSERNMSRLRETKKRHEIDLKQLKEHLDNQTSENEIQKLKQQNEADQVKYEERQKELESILAGCVRDAEMYNNTKTHYREKFDELKTKRTVVLNDIAGLERQKKQINLKARNNLQLYGDFMPGLVADIDRLHKQGKFSEMPLGPVGSYIEVNDAKYVRYVEEVCKNVLPAFYVNNSQDRAILSALIKRSYRQQKIPIITSKFLKKTYNTAQNGVRGDAHSYPVMDLIKVENPDIMNCLIDQCKVDTILITDKQNHAMNITSRKENVPANLLKVIVTEPYTEFYPAPVYRSYSKQYFSTAKYLQLNMEQRERYIEAELNKQSQRRAQLEEQLKEWQQKLRNNEQRLTEVRERRTKLQPEVVNLRLKIKELVEFEYPAEDEAMVMENEIKEQSKRLDALAAKIEEETAQCAALKAERDIADKEMNKLRLEKEKSSTSIEDKRYELDQLSQKICTCLSAKKYNEAKLQKHTDSVDKLTAELNAAQKKLETLIRAASKFGERVEITENSVDAIIKKIKRKERTIERINATADTPERLKQILDKAERDYSENGRIVKSLTDTIGTLHHSTKLRLTQTQKLNNYMQSQISYQFKTIMNLRGFQGQLEFNNEEQTLNLRVLTRGENSAAATSKANSLSGGERSYSTVALLIALWYCVDSPFYFLDEYDVFTDQVNRMFMTKLLLGEANKNPHKQYAFLTPQDISDLNPTKALSILRMEDPERP